MIVLTPSLFYQLPTNTISKLRLLLKVFFFRTYLYKFHFYKMLTLVLIECCLHFGVYGGKGLSIFHNTRKGCNYRFDKTFIFLRKVFRKRCLISTRIQFALVVILDATQLLQRLLVCTELPENVLVLSCQIHATIINERKQLAKSHRFFTIYTL